MSGVESSGAGKVDTVGATISAADATAIRWRAVVVGAGPGGAATARRLAVRGVPVLLVDAAAMPRPKLCGCCLSSAAVGELRRLAEACGDGQMPAGALPLVRVRLATAAVSAVVPLEAGRVISRESLDAFGVRAAITAGAAWLPGTRVAGLRETTHEGRPAVAMRLGPGRDTEPLPEILADLAVVATGLADPVRIATGGSVPAARDMAAAGRLGIGTTLPAGSGGPPPGELVMAVAPAGYCGVVRLEDGRIDIAAAVDPRALAAAGSPATLVARLLRQTTGDLAAGLATEELGDLLAAATFRGTPTLTRSRPVASASGRIVRVGDAAGYVEPLTGEGMGWALASARLCDEAYGASLAAGGLPPDAIIAAGSRYARRHRGHFARHHARCRRVSRAARHPWLVGPAVRLARLAPTLAARVVPLMVGGTWCVEPGQ